jgi:SNF2 family DNA or RNA helicase
VCNTIVFFAIWWDLETHDQLIERIGPMRQMQAGLDREVMVYQILARGTIDDIVVDRLITKRATQDATFDTFAYKPPEEQLW